MKKSSLLVAAFLVATTALAQDIARQDSTVSAKTKISKVEKVSTKVRFNRQAILQKALDQNVRLSLDSTAIKAKETEK